MCFPQLPLMLKQYMFVKNNKCFSQQIAISDTLISYWLVTNVSSDVTTVYPCKQQQIAGPAQAVGLVGLWPYHFSELEKTN